MGKKARKSFRHDIESLERQTLDLNAPEQAFVLRNMLRLIRMARRLLNPTAPRNPPPRE